MESPAIQQNRNKKRLFLWLILAIYVVLGILGLSHHEMWRDELHSWVIAKNSDTISELFQNKRYEGHPLFWYFVMFLIAKISNNFILIQFVHLGFAVLGMAVFLFWSTFTTWQKALFPFGYFMIFEYFLLSRNYAPAFLFLFIALIVMRRFPKKLIIFSLSLFLAMQCNVFALIISLALIFSLLLEHRKNISEFTKLNNQKHRLILAIIIILAGIFLSVFSLIPPSNSNFGAWGFGKADQVISVFWTALVPVPDFSFHFWNSNFIDSVFLRLLLSILLFVFCIFAFLRYPFVLKFFLITALGFFTFIATQYFGFLRHHGHFYILVILCYYLTIHEKEKQITIKNKYFKSLEAFAYKQRFSFLTLLLIIQIIPGAYAWYRDWKDPFSASEAAYEFIIENKYDQPALVGDVDAVSESVTARMNKPVFDPRQGRKRDILFFSSERSKVLKVKDILNSIDSFAREENSDLLLVLNYPLETLSEKHNNIRKLKYFEKSIEEFEVFYLYLYKTR